MKKPLRAHSQPLASCHGGLASPNALFVTGSFLQTQCPYLKAALSLPPAHPGSIQPPPMGQAGLGLMENQHLWAGVLLCFPTPQHRGERAGSNDLCIALSSIDSFTFAPEHSAAPWSLSCHCGAPAGPAPLMAQQRELPGTGNVPFPVPPELCSHHRRFGAADATQTQWLQ